MKVLLARVFSPLVLITMATAAQAQREPYTYSHMWSGGWGGMIFGPLMMVLFIALIVVIVVLAVRWAGGGHGHRHEHGQHRRDRPLSILRERFARGEIDKAEFEDRRRTLGE